MYPTENKIFRIRQGRYCFLFLNFIEITNIDAFCNIKVLAFRNLEIPKVVFTKTLNKSDWPNTNIATGDFRNEITKLKNLDGRDIVVYGGISFDSSLIKENLIDEFYLFNNPIILGSGKTIFKDFKEIQKLTLTESKVFDCGLVLIHYEVKKN